MAADPLPAYEPAENHLERIWSELRSTLVMVMPAGEADAYRPALEKLIKDDRFKEYPVRGRAGEAWAYVERLIGELHLNVPGDGP